MASLLAIGNNCCDIYTTTGKMYPGGECANTAVYASMQGIRSGFLGMFGDDDLASFMKETLKEQGVDLSHAMTFEGENGYTLAHLENGDRVFTGRNYGGVMRFHPFDFTEEDLLYIRSFDLLYAGLHAHTDEVMEQLHAQEVPVAFDFSFEERDEYFEKIAPFADIALLSLGKRSMEEGKSFMKHLASFGPKVVVGTMGERGSLVLYQGSFHFQEALNTERAVDTMGAGDSYFATFLSMLLTKAEKQGHTLKELLNKDKKEIGADNKVTGNKEEILATMIPSAMEKAAEFASYICTLSGPYGKEGQAPDQYLEER